MGTLLLPRAAPSTARTVNDVHSRLNATRVADVRTPAATDELAETLARADADGRPVCVCGGRHAMGGQQFARDALLLDTSRLDRILHLDPARGLVRAQAGILWPALISQLLDLHGDWTIAQKQTGADRMSLGGALGANIHGRALTLPPIAGQVDSFLLIRPDGSALRCSREANADLFSLAIGGYGLFGVIAEVDLRLRPRTKLQRLVRLIQADELADALASHIADGAEYGDFQFGIDPASPGFLRRGILSCYRPADPAAPIPVGQHRIDREGWLRLIHLAHTDKRRAFEEYREHYLATDGQIYWSDFHQLAEYVEAYHPEIDRRLGCSGSEMITELFVRPDRLAPFLADAAEALRRHDADAIYGTVRLARRDADTFLPWAREDCAGVVINLHADHTAAGIDRAARAFRALADCALAHGGTFYLTYHRFFTRDQLLAAYPSLPAFAAAKARLDPNDTMRSDWWTHTRRLTEGADARLAG